jgi:SAM-dependent methyltransferase
MNWRGTQAESRERAYVQFDEAEAERWAVGLSVEVEDAYLVDFARVFAFEPGMAVLDVGAGTGVMCSVLSRLPGLSLTALEPMPAMLARVEGARGVLGFCDAPEDRAHFPEASFDAIISRQVANGLYDPLTAFRNWHHWLKPGGAVVLIDGLFDRSAWAGKFEVELDVMPLSTGQSTALVPYLLESVGFSIRAVEPMRTVNVLGRFTRYVVVALKP